MTKIIQSGPFHGFHLLLIACLRVEVTPHVAELGKGTADYISIMAPIPGGITSNGTSTFCTPPKPLPSVEHPSPAACQMLLLHNALAI